MGCSVSKLPPLGSKRSESKETNPLSGVNKIPSEDILLNHTFVLIGIFYNSVSEYSKINLRQSCFKELTAAMDSCRRSLARYEDILPRLTADDIGRFCVHMSVKNLNESIEFTTKCVRKENNANSSSQDLSLVTSNLRKTIKKFDEDIMHESCRIINEQSEVSQIDETVMLIAKLLYPINETFTSEVESYLERIDPDSYEWLHEVVREWMKTEMIPVSAGFDRKSKRIFLLCCQQVRTHKSDPSPNPLLT